MSPEKWMMLLVGGAGLYFGYRLLIAPKDQEPQPPVPLEPVRVPIVVPPLQGTAGPIGEPPPGFPLVTPLPTRQYPPTIELLNSRAYRGRLELAPDASSDLVRAIVASMGFEPDSIQIFSTPEEAAPHIAPFALQNPGPGTRWFHARFLQSSQSVGWPDQLVALWTVARAPMRVAGLSPSFAWSR